VAPAANLPGVTMVTNAPDSPPALVFSDVDLDRGATPVLRSVTWQVGRGERWAVLGPNGGGKTTLMQMASGYLHPTRGTADVRALRQQLGTVSASVARMIVPWLPAREVVVSARHGALEPWWHDYSGPDRAKALALLAAAGFEGIADRPFGVLSEGERQQVLLARALMISPALLLLDEPCAGLDLGAREALLSRLSDLARDPTAPPLVMVTHHVEEIPVGFSHVLLLRQGRVVARGPLEQVMTGATLSDCFGLALAVQSHRGRWASQAISRA